MRSKRSIAIPFLLALALACALPAAASADRAAIRAERLQLRDAVERSRIMPNPIRRGSFALRRARMSTVGRWALATIAPTGRARARLDSITALFEHRRRAWHIYAAGTAGVGCEKLIVPRDVRRDLGIVCATS